MPKKRRIEKSGVGDSGLEVRDSGFKYPLPNTQPPILYESLLPLEIGNVKDTIIEYFRSIKFASGVNNPSPHIANIILRLKSNPYERFDIAKINGEIAGYIWYHVATDVTGEVFLKIEHHFIREPFRGNIKLYKGLIERAITFGARCGARYAIIEVHSSKLQRFYHNRGFRTLHAVMEFRGTLDDFIAHNKLWRYLDGRENKTEDRAPAGL